MKSEYTQEFRDRAVELTLRDDRSVPMIAEELGINPQTLYSWRRDYQRKASKAPRSEAAARVTQAEEIAELHRELKRVPEERDILKKAVGESISRRRSRRLMKRNELEVRRPKGWVPRTTDSCETARIAANLLGQDFTTERINQRWVSDITYIATDEGWLYLCVVLDLSSRRVVGYQTGRRLSDVKEHRCNPRRRGGGHGPGGAWASSGADLSQRPGLAVCL